MAMQELAIIAPIQSGSLASLVHIEEVVLDFTLFGMVQIPANENKKLVAPPI